MVVHFASPLLPVTVKPDVVVRESDAQSSCFVGKATKEKRRKSFRSWPSTPLATCAIVDREVPMAEMPTGGGGRSLKVDVPKSQ